MNSTNQQRTLAMMTGFERYTKKTRRAMFLEEMEQVAESPSFPEHRHWLI